MVTVFVNAAQANCFNLWVELCKSVLAGRINECRRELELPAINNWEKWANRPEIFLACWPEWFCGSTPSWPQRTCHAGFLWNDTVESGVLPEAASKALTASSKPILITGGTSSWRMAARFYAVAADACARAQCSGILVCPDNQFIPAPMPPNVTRFAELPFASVMPHVAAVIHHGGFGTMVRAMLAGIPQIIVPFGADRRDNAIRIERLGIGVRVAPAYWNAVEIASLIDRAMQKTDLTDNLAQARKAILADSCLPTACSDIEALLKP
jgi:UDP:flavonoid glycosyltransferase YjiC (YdhE family)